MIVVAHPTGSANARMAAAEFERLGLLESFHVGLNIDLAHPLIRHLPENVLRHLRRRSYDLPQAKMRSFPMVEGTMLALENLPGSPCCRLTHLYRHQLMNRYFDWRMSRALHTIKSPVFYGFVGSCLQSARTARKLGRLIVTEVTSVASTHHENLRLEAGLNPDWADSSSYLTDKNKAYQLNRQEEVFRLSDFLIAPSQYAAKCIPSYFQEKVIFANYPYSDCAAAVETAGAGAHAKLKILFAGSLGQGKGLQYLKNALEALDDQFELTLVGSASGTPCRELAALLDGVTWYRTLPNRELRALMGKQDVLVLPSISDSFGLVVTEALSQGTPVIVSENTGAKDQVIDGKNGFVVPVRDAGAIAARLTLLQKDRELLARMSEQALAIAREEAGLPYLGKVIDRLHDLLGQQRPGRFDRLASPELAT